MRQPLRAHHELNFNDNKKRGRGKTEAMDGLLPKHVSRWVLDVDAASGGDGLSSSGVDVNDPEAVDTWLERWNNNA